MTPPSTLRNISLLTHFLRQRFFTMLFTNLPTQHVPALPCFYIAWKNYKKIVKIIFWTFLVEKQYFIRKS